MINPDECMSCQSCLDNICPKDAIRQDKKGKVYIDKDLCLVCHSCDGICPAEDN